MQRQHNSQLHQHIVRLNCLNGRVEASRAPTMVFPAVSHVCDTYKDIPDDMKALELQNASLYLLLDTTICQFSTAVPSFESGQGTQCKSEETA